MTTKQFPVLRQKMRERKIKRPEMAAAIGKSCGSLSGKMCGKQKFTLQEAFLIRDTFFPGWSIDDLFGT